MYLDLVERMIPDPTDREIFLTWCAAFAQNPGKKFQWAIVLQGVEGNGKTFLLNTIKHAVTTRYAHMPEPDNLNEKFNGYLEEKLFVGVEEIHMGGRRTLLDKLKPYITNTDVEIRRMNTDKYMGINLTNWIFLTNHKDAVLKSRNDRRFATIFTAQQREEDLVRDGMDGMYFPNLWRWAKGGGFADIVGYLKGRELDARFDPLGACHRAPKTSSSDEAVTESYGQYESFIVEAIEDERQGFREGWISSWAVREYLREQGLKAVNPKIIGQAIVNIGYELIGRGPKIVAERLSRPQLYRKIGDNREINRYIIDQGYDKP